MNIPNIRTQIETRAAVVIGLACFAKMPGNLAPPAFVLYPDDPFITVESMGRGGAARLNFQGVLYVQVGSDWGTAQDKLDAYLSSTAGDETTSLLDALVSTATVSDATLGGSLHVSQVAGYGLAQFSENAPAYLSATVSMYLAMLRS